MYLLLVTSTGSQAAGQWYTGSINRIWPHNGDGGFIVTFKPTAAGLSSLDDCKHKYAYFYAGSIQPEMLKNSFSLALSAFHMGSLVGIVIDKDQNGEYCHAMSVDVRK
ncbi:MAG: hypothetical protein P1U80_00850 [Pseudomonadales bacterium]|nr:hypothetical protein [Pseudomonadales bacterium]